MIASPPRVESRTVGRWKVHAIQAGGQKLDGGAMFGIVPKPLWERHIAADQRNRVQLGMRCLLVEHDEGLVLIDTAAGNKESDRFVEIYGLENSGASGRTWLEDGIAALGMAPEDVRIVIQTHLHFDHAGGNTYLDADGQVRPAFPNARHFVQRGELAFATQTNERIAASYFPRNWEILEQNGRLELVDGEPEIVAGIRVIRTPGHVPHHQSVLVDGGGGEVACFLGDLCPTPTHLRLPWIMGYDVEPLVTLETKRTLFRRAVDERWLLVFEHDWEVPWGYLRHDGKGYALET